jgi:hypothetical protein
MEKAKIYFLKNVFKTKLLLVVAIASMAIAPSIYAQFAIQEVLEGPSDSGLYYGYGNGFGYGYGFDGGTYSGYRVDGDTPLNEYGYGRGYGYLAEDVDYDAENGYSVDADSILNLVQLGVIAPPVGSIPSNTTEIVFFQKVTLEPFPGASVIIPEGTTMTATGNFDFSSLTAGIGNTAGLVNVTTYGDLQFGLPDLGLTINPAISISLPVPGVANGTVLKVYRKSPDSSSWVQFASCTVASEICTFSTNRLSQFAAGTPVSSGGGGSVVVASPCTEVSYDEWGSCVNGMQYRNLLGQVPSGCTLTAEQQSARSKVCSGSGTGIQATVGAIISDIDVMGVMTRERAMVGKVDTALTNRLSGRILLQVEEKGQAWYLEPLTKKKHFMGRPFDAFNLMRKFGLGISNANLKKFQDTGVPRAFAGRILLQVEANGEAYYVNPVDLKLHYLGRPADAFRIMRELSLGISNIDIRQISVGE